MDKKLVIVESPNKIKKISSFLGSEYIVKASFGHIRDLDKKDLSIDVTNNFKPTYIISPDKKNVISELKREMKKCSVCYLASDFDREGESIAWHISQVLKLTKNTRKRILFTEITKKAILKSLENPGDIDMNMFNAQQARRVLDRLIGYKISPVLWKEIQSSMKKGESLSAGRVQSVVVKMLMDRENEIAKFAENNFYKVVGCFVKDDITPPLDADLSIDFKNYDCAHGFMSSCLLAKFIIGDINNKTTTRNPSAPFITSTLQQEASNKFRMTPKTTMMTAQKLYEAGYITYMRTDSTILSEDAIDMIKDYVEDNYGLKYFKERVYKSKNANSQDAHEAIRPCLISRTSIEMGSNEDRLYKLIWNRTVASQMEAAKVMIINYIINVSDREEHFISRFEKILFDGFLKLTNINNAIEPPDFKKGDILNRKKITCTEKFTKPSNTRYTEASLIRDLEKKGIGRPSTYSSIISLIQDRNYAIKKDINGASRNCKIIELIGELLTQKDTEIKINTEKQKLVPTATGKIVTSYLDKTFPTIMDYQFTKKIETDLDNVANGKKIWYKIVKNVYDIINPKIIEILERSCVEKSKYSRVLGVDPKTKEDVIVYIGKYGPVVKIKDKFASIKDHDIEKIKLDEALLLFKYPYILGEYKNSNIEVKKGKFGEYIVYKNKNYSFAGDITLDLAIEIINRPKESKSKIIKTINDNIIILDGKYGAYIRYKNKQNIKISGYNKDVSELTLNECIVMINKANSKKKYSSNNNG